MIYDPQTTIPAGSSYTRTPFLGNMIQANRFDPVTAKLINAYPAPQTSGLTNNYISNMVQRQNWDQGDVRVDNQFTSSDTFFARYRSSIRTQSFRTRSADSGRRHSSPHPAGQRDSFAGTSATPVQHAAADYTHIFDRI